MSSDSSQTRVFLVNDSTGQNNWGCRATTIGLAKLISEAGGNVVGRLRHFPSTRPGSLRDLALATARLNRRIEPVLRRAYSILRSDSIPRSVSEFDKVANAVDAGRLWRDTRDDMAHSDFVLVNGEGSIYADEAKGYRELFWAWYGKERLGKRVAIVNHTADLSSPMLRAVAELTYSVVDDVCFRESRSAELCAPVVGRSLGPIDVPDAAFVHGAPGDKALLGEAGCLDIWPHTASTLDASAPFVAVTGSSAINRPGNREIDILAEQYTTLCQGLVSAGLQVLLVAPDPTDLEFMELVVAKTGLPLVPPSLPLPLARRVLGHASCLVGGRWHPAILAALGGTPLVLASANTHKTEALARMLPHSPQGPNGGLFDAATVGEDSAAIVACVEDLLAGGDRLRSEIQDSALEYGKAAAGNVRILHHFAG